MDRLQLLKLIKGYEKGTLSPHEKKIIESYFESLQKKGGEWDELVMGDEEVIEEKIYSKLVQLINDNETNLVKKIVSSPSFLKIAAMIIIFISIIFGTLYIIDVHKEKNNLQTWNEKVTKIGEKSILTFLDGTKIILNANSRLKYPVNSSRYKREVYLEGEAYFEVAKDTSRPFKVYSGNIITTVMGTSFNIEAYPSENEIQISLVRGIVKVSKLDNKIKEDLVVLKPEQQLTYSKIDDVSKVGKFDKVETIGWKDNILKFNNVPLKKVFVKLERFYGLQFELLNESKANLKITANFQEESLRTVAEVIKNLTGLQYKSVVQSNIIKKVVFY
ncbi:FecR family protein [Melioribacteraceae bacterium 4301-Me]|uniref:FecR family protein n=1 Tax=Pyranulibacter aquaticus TaxID=3163344 RepID=UPI00359AFD3D